MQPDLTIRRMFMSNRIRNSLAAERAARGWSQSRAAALGGISRQSYAAIESGEAVPSTEVSLRLARGFGRRVEELFRLPEAPAEQLRARWAGSGQVIGRRVRLTKVGGDLVAYGAGEGGAALVAADGIVRRLDGEDVEVTLLPERPPEVGLVAVGCDPGFALVVDAMRRERGVEICWTQRGSRPALEALARGEAHVAGAHLRDPATGEYNGPWIQKLVPFPCTRVSFALWEQGIIVGSGNPKGIGGVEDLVRPDLRFLNREPGSGSRALLDEQLRGAGLAADCIAGYDTGARGHMMVAEAIASGLADAGIGIRAAGSAYGLDVLPLVTERYELIIPNHFLDLPAVRLLLETLRRPSIRAQIEALGGYDAAAIGEAV